MTISSEFEYSRVRRPPVRAQRGESAVACSPTFWSRSDSRPARSSGLDSGEPFWRSQTVPTM